MIDDGGPMNPNRRQFSWALFGGVTALALPPRAAVRALARSEVDGDRLMARLTDLARIGATPEGGTHRVAYSEADREARAAATQWMEEAGLTVTVDLAGNLVGRRSGRRPDLPALALGSHIDSVPAGGRFDGQVGSMAAIEVVHTLTDRGLVTDHPLELYLFQNEEGGKTGSRALIGAVQPDELDLVTASGRTIRDGIRFLGGDPDRLDEARRQPGSIAAFLELHVEQGAVLHRRGIPIGVVEGIVGIRRWYVDVEGFANHAGTTPMDHRRDALLAAARFVDAVHRTARARPGRHVATVGRIAAEPGAPNVIAGSARLSLEIRDLSMEGIDAVFEACRSAAQTIATDTGTTFAFTPFYESRAAPTDPRFRDAIEAAARARNLATLRLPSGAGHDAQSMALLGPVGMIFVPSVDGISHSPREYSRPDDIVAGANVLLDTVLHLDRGDG